MYDQILIEYEIISRQDNFNRISRSSMSVSLCDNSRAISKKFINLRFHIGTVFLSCFEYRSTLNDVSKERVGRCSSFLSED